MNGCCELHPEPPEDLPPGEKWEYWNNAHQYHAKKAQLYSTIALILLSIAVILLTVSVILRSM